MNLKKFRKLNEKDFRDSVSEFVKAEPDDILFCGMCIGYCDKKQKVNSLKSERRPLEDWAKFL